MAHKFWNTKSFVFAIVLSTLLACQLAPLGFAQEKHGAQAAGVDKTKMGPYRALADLAYAAFEKGDGARASEIAQILERVWDKSEDYGGETALSKTNPALFKEVDAAMDGFITPLTDYAKKAPDKTKVKAAYNAYLEKLKLAD